jgi:RND family efflux transporter MFP subunit
MDNVTSQNRLRLALGAALLSALALAVSSCNKNGKAAGRTPEAESFPTVAVVKASIQDLSKTVVLTAEFRPFQEIDVMAKVAGYIKEIRVDVGDRVRQGELLATLEIPEMADDLARAKAAVDRSTAEVARAQDEIKRAESSHEIAHLSYERLAEVSRKRPGLVAQQEIDDAHSKDLGAEAQLAAATSNRAAAVQQVDVNKAELAKVNTMHDYTRVTAPFAGVVTKRYADTGSMIQAGTASQTQAMPVVRLSQNSLLRLTLPVPESVVPTVHVGEQVDVKVPSLNRTFQGKVARFSDKVQLTTRTMDTEVDVPNPSLVLIPGMYAEVTLSLSRRNAALAIPVSAVYTGDAAGDPTPAQQSSSSATSTGQVMTVNADHRIEVRKVTLGIETADLIEVRSGLNEGDLVIIGNRGSLQPGQQVDPKITRMASTTQSRPKDE